jgi:hypothetical protein
MKTGSAQGFCRSGRFAPDPRKQRHVDRDGNKLDDFAHAELSGVHLQGSTAEDVTYLRPMPGAEGFLSGYDATYPLSVDRHAVLVGPTTMCRSWPV